MYQIPEFLKIPNLTHYITTKKEGNLSAVFEKEEVIVKSLEKIFKGQSFGVEDVIKMVVDHENTIVSAEEKFKGVSLRNWKLAPKADGLVTNKKGTFLFLLVADCLPVILFDPKKKVLGLMHIGWKNADLNTTKVMIKKMKTMFKIDPKDLVIGFGPAARKESFVKDVVFQAGDPKWQPFLERLENGNYKVDFVGLCKNQLIDEGILKENIYDCNIDTIKDKRFFSHYRDKNLPIIQQGRFACIVGME